MKTLIQFVYIAAVLIVNTCEGFTQKFSRGKLSKHHRFQVNHPQVDDDVRLDECNERIKCAFEDNKCVVPRQHANYEQNKEYYNSQSDSKQPKTCSSFLYNNYPINQNPPKLKLYDLNSESTYSIVKGNYIYPVRILNPIPLSYFNFKPIEANHMSNNSSNVKSDVADVSMNILSGHKPRKPLSTNDATAVQHPQQQLQEVTETYDTTLDSIETHHKEHIDGKLIPPIGIYQSQTTDQLIHKPLTSDEETVHTLVDVLDKAISAGSPPTVDGTKTGHYNVPNIHITINQDLKPISDLVYQLIRLGESSPAKGNNRLPYHDNLAKYLESLKFNSPLHNSIFESSSGFSSLMNSEDGVDAQTPDPQQINDHSSNLSVEGGLTSNFSFTENTDKFSALNQVQQKEQPLTELHSSTDSTKPVVTLHQSISDPGNDLGDVPVQEKIRPIDNSRPKNYDYFFDSSINQLYKQQTDQNIEVNKKTHDYNGDTFADEYFQDSVLAADPQTGCNQFTNLNKGLRFTCPSGLKFNNDLQVCDWAVNVDC
ncbi:hypothetical protein GJ496_002129 [Pomphorhynchus laevis]|nr:hypothetical protein GJ496_002129 [Pomphorhynchus laevis]